MSIAEDKAEMSIEASLEESTKDEDNKGKASNKKSSTKSIEFNLERNVEYQPVDQVDSRESIESEIELSPATAPRFEPDVMFLQMAGSGTETDDEDSSKADAKDLTLKNSVSSRILHRKKTQTWKSNTLIRDPDSKESTLPLEIITVKAPGQQVAVGKPVPGESAAIPEFPDICESAAIPDIHESKLIQNIQESKAISGNEAFKAIPSIQPSEVVPDIQESKVIPDIQKTEAVPNSPIPIPDVPKTTEDELIAAVLINHLKKDTGQSAQMDSDNHRVEIDVVEPKRLAKKLVPSSRNNRIHNPIESVNHVTVEYHDNVSVWEGADIAIPVVYEDTSEDLQEPPPPPDVQIITVDNLPNLPAGSPQDARQLHSFIGSVLQLHDIVQARQKSPAPQDQKQNPPSSKYFNREVYEYLHKATGSSNTSVTAASSTSTVRSSKDHPNETTAPYAWKWKAPTKDSADVQEDKPKMKRRASGKAKFQVPILVPDISSLDSPSDTSSLASWASSTLEKRKGEKKKSGTIKTTGDDEKDSLTKKNYFRSSTAERLAMPKGSSYLEDTEFAGLVSTCNSIVQRTFNMSRDGGCKSAGTVMVSTQTPRENERLLTPTLLRKKLKPKTIAASSTQTPRIAKTAPNLDLTKKLPLVPKTKVESGVQTSEPVKKVEKVVKDKPKTPVKQTIKPKIAKTVKELSLKSSDDESVVTVPNKSSGSTELGRRTARSALKSAATTPPKRPGSVRFLDSDASAAEEPANIKTTGQPKKSVKVVANEKLKDVSIQDLPGRPVSAISSAQAELSSTAQLKPKYRQGVKLKKVKVSSTKSADHIGLTYRRRSPSPGRKSPRSRSRSKNKETRGIKLDTFSNLTMIAPSSVPSGVEYVDLNIIVRRKDLDGNYPSIEELVQEVGGDNFCLVLDQDAPLKARRLLVAQDEKKVTYYGKPGDVSSQNTFLSFLPNLKCPPPDGRPFFYIPFGKIPVIT